MSDQQFRHKDTNELFRRDASGLGFVGTTGTYVSNGDATSQLRAVPATPVTPRIHYSQPVQHGGSTTGTPPSTGYPTPSSLDYTTRPTANRLSSNESPTDQRQQTQASIASRGNGSLQHTQQATGQLASAIASMNIGGGNRRPSVSSGGRAPQPPYSQAATSPQNESRPRPIAGPSRPRPNQPHVTKHIRDLGDSYQRVLDHRYRRKPPKFFKRGRVFKVYWPEPAGDEDDASITTYSTVPLVRERGTTSSGYTVDRQFGEKIYSKIRWLIVVRPGSYSCVCVPIVTYGGQGVAKRGVTKNEHAIAHIPDVVPRAEPDEEPERGENGMRDSICIQPDETGDILELLSRIDYSRVYTVEHNVKVMPFGFVHPHSEEAFFYSFQAVFFGEDNDNEGNDSDENEDEEADSDDDSDRTSMPGQSGSRGVGNNQQASRGGPASSSSALNTSQGTQAQSSIVAPYQIPQGSAQVAAAAQQLSSDQIRYPAQQQIFRRQQAAQQQQQHITQPRYINTEQNHASQQQSQSQQYGRYSQPVQYSQSPQHSQLQQSGQLTLQQYSQSPPYSQSPRPAPSPLAQRQHDYIVQSYALQEQAAGQQQAQQANTPQAYQQQHQVPANSSAQQPPQQRQQQRGSGNSAGRDNRPQGSKGSKSSKHSKR